MEVSQKKEYASVVIAILFLILMISGAISLWNKTTMPESSARSAASSSSPRVITLLNHTEKDEYVLTLPFMRATSSDPVRGSSHSEKCREAFELDYPEYIDWHVYVKYSDVADDDDVSCFLDIAPIRNGTERRHSRVPDYVEVEKSKEIYFELK